MQARSQPFGPTPITPTKLAYVQPVPGLHGNRGRTLTAVLDTIVDLDRQVIGATLQVQQKLPSGSSFGGLHGGYAKLSPSVVSLHNLTFVPGVELSGMLPAKEGSSQSITIHVSGAAATHGTITLGGSGRASGILAGERFNVSTTRAQLSRRIRRRARPRANGRSARSAGSRWRPGATSSRHPNHFTKSRVGGPKQSIQPRHSLHKMKGRGPKVTYNPQHPDADAQRARRQTSPYLRQHAENPVDWLPWGPGA